MHDEQDADAGSKLARWTVQTSQDVDAGLAERDDDGEEFLRSLIEFAIALQVEVHVNEMSAGEQLEDHAGGNDGRNTQFHQRAAITGQHHAQPI